MATKTCSKCGATSPLENFSYVTSERTRRRGECRPCVAANTAAWKRANPERRAQWTADNPARQWLYRTAYRARKNSAYVEDVIPLVVLERDDGVCGICGEDVDPFDFHVDHIHPLAHGGDHSYDNVQAAHPVCNWRKSDSVLVLHSIAELPAGEAIDTDAAGLKVPAEEN